MVESVRMRSVGLSERVKVDDTGTDRRVDS